jgi:alpha-beta hydrolase superfamily lysophospholipase
MPATLAITLVDMACFREAVGHLPALTMPMQMRRAAVLFFSVLAVAALLCLVAGEALSHPALHEIGRPPESLAAKPFLLQAGTSGPISGWRAQGSPGAGVVLLLHGVRGDRREMIGRAEFLHRLGYSVVLIDLPGHGESPAPHITFGANESQGVRSALAYVSREFPGERVGVIGVSLGAASLVLARPDPAPDAVVLESMFPTITDAVADRLRLHLGEAAVPLAPLLLGQLPLRLGVRPEQLRPISALPSLKAPVLIASGSADQHTRLAETLRLYEAASAPKELWVVEGAAHVDLHRFTRAAYEARISTFLAAHLRRRAS